LDLSSQISTEEDDVVRLLRGCNCVYAISTISGTVPCSDEQECRRKLNRSWSSSENSTGMKGIFLPRPCVPVPRINVGHRQCSLVACTSSDASGTYLPEQMPTVGGAGGRMAYSANAGLTIYTCVLRRCSSTKTWRPLVL
jgi:hypothetical protein